MSTGFSIDWLEERFRFDAAARNKQLEQKCLEWLAPHATAHLVDVGAGSGSNARYWIPKIPQAQNWTLVEQDADILRKGLQRLGSWAQTQGMECKIRSDWQWQFQQGDKEIHIQGKVGSLLALSDHVALAQQHLVMANAVFDLFSVHPFEKFCQLLQKYPIAFYPTINYTGMAFEKNHEADQQIVDWYEGHMQQERPDGKSMGKTCGEVMQTVWNQLGGDCDAYPSNWEITESDVALKTMLLGYIRGALGELTLTELERQVVEPWCEFRMQAHAGKMYVQHVDIWAQ